MAQQTKTRLIIGCVVAVIVLIICSVLGYVLFRSFFLGSGVVKQESRDVSGYTKIRLDTNGDIQLEQGSIEGLTVEAEDNVLPRLKSEVKDGTLVLSLANAFPGMIYPTKPVVFKVRVKDLSDITINGSGSVKTTRLQASSLNLDIIGSGKVNMDVFVDRINSTINGNGDLTISGNSNSQTITINGSGKYVSDEMRGKDCNSTINGSGEIILNCRNSLDITINGTGSVSYYGSPTIGNQQISGNGTVKNLGDAKRN
jgi:hypothetical protein